MDSKAEAPRRLYCHYFHTNQSCKKEERCKFLHGPLLTSCPNGDRCPIKVPHAVVDLPTTASKESKTQRETIKKSDVKPKLEIQDIAVVPKTEQKKKDTVIFTVTLTGGWDDKDIIRDLAPTPVATSSIIKKTVESTKSNKNKSSESIKNSIKEKIDDLEKKDKKVEIISKPSKVAETTKNGGLNKVEEEIEEQKANFVKPASNIVIQKELPSAVSEFINKNYKNNEEAKNFISNFYFMNEDMRNFLPIYERLFPKLELDLMFICDCTGSMSSWIEAVKLEITGIVAAIKNQHQGSNIRVSFVGYRDYGDEERYSIFNFSEDMEEFQKFVGGVQATGGSDAAEDVAGGFKHANLQNWKSKAKYAVLLADAPAHGKIYHGDSADFYDRYPKGDPDGVDLKSQFCDLIRKGVKLYLVEIMKSTQMMFNIFKDYYKEVCNQELDIQKLGSSTLGFGQYISQTASQTLSMSYTQETKEDPQGAFYKALKICQGQNTSQSVDFLGRYNFKDQSNQTEQERKNRKDIQVIEFKVNPSKLFPQPFNSKILEAVCHTYFIVQDKGVPINWRKPLVQNSSIKTTIKINALPFAEGAMRYAFFAEDTLLKQRLVAKINKKQNSKNVELNKEDMVKDLESQFICQHIVNQFNDRVSEHVLTTANLKNFVHCFIYEIKDTKHPYKYYSAENYIEGEYEKFNNNAGWCNLRYDEPGLLSQALSHFSYQITEGYLMIVDLQGVGSLLTDPQIHCLDQNRFGAGNLGYQGMFKFFLSHQCNKYCQSLGLLHPNTKQIPTKMQFFNDTLVVPTNFDKQVFCMCDLCKVPFQTTAFYLYNKRKQCQEKYCPPCDQKRSQTLKSAKCTSCTSSFKSSTYWFLMKRTDFPELCGPCRKLRRERMRAELL